MAPKNKKKNSFYFFMKEMQDREAAKGRNISIRDMPTLAHPIWQRLSLVERAPYEKMARAYNKDPNLRGGKLQSDGTRVEDYNWEMEERERKENSIKQAIKNYCNINCMSEAEFKDFTSRKLFYFLSFNILCHTEQGVYIPNEVGLVEYSIQHGIHKEYHRILRPGQIPTGYKGEAKRLCEDKHNIDIFGEQCGEGNMRFVYDDIKDFTNPLGSDEYPPVFCLDSEVELTNGCLDWLAEKAGDVNYFVVWNAVYLLMELRAGVGHPFPAITTASDLLHRTSFDYNPDAVCKFHYEKDVHFCALAYSKRLCYLFSDAVCPLFDVDLTEKHMPTLALEEKAYLVTMANNSQQYPTANLTPTFSEPNTPGLDRHSGYYSNEVNEEDQFVDAPSVRTNTTLPFVPRQPASSCLAEEMSRLHLNITAATVPGHGIGRGQRREN